MRLFARDLKGNIKEWNISQIDDTNARISTGRLNGSLIQTIIYHPDIKKEIASRIAKKRKEGYVSLKDLGQIMIGDSEYRFLNEHLPKCNTDANNNLKPMKCQKFQEGKVKYPALGQPKLNGLRAVLRWESWIEGEGMFAGNIEGAKLRTKEGLEYVMPHITEHLRKEMFECELGELVFDGELYKHGMPLNRIKASCPMTNSRGTISTPSGDPLDISFYIFDLAIPDIPQDGRLATLSSCNILEMLNIKHVSYTVLDNDEQAQVFRDGMIRLGYEGCVIRDPDAEYAFGQRPKTIRKFKDHIDSEFLIVGVTPKPSDPSLPMLILKNDINDATFESVLMGSYEYQREVMRDIDSYIGKYATVRYRERTGTSDKLPFHTNVLERPFVSDIRNKKDE